MLGFLVGFAVDGVNVLLFGLLVEGTLDGLGATVGRLLGTGGGMTSGGSTRFPKIAVGISAIYCRKCGEIVVLDFDSQLALRKVEVYGG